MRYVQAAVMWLMDVIVAVFIGPVGSGERARKIKRLASRRGTYALGFACTMLLVATLYAVALRSSGKL